MLIRQWLGIYTRAATNPLLFKVYPHNLGSFQVTTKSVMAYSTNYSKKKDMEIEQDTSQKEQENSQKKQTKGQESSQDKNLFADKIRNHKPEHIKNPISPQQLTEQIRFQQKLAQKEHDLPEWQKRDDSIRKRHGTWNPTKKLSRQQMQDIRNLSDQMPHLKTIDLANYYQVSPEAIRRILASTWVPKESEEDSILERGQRRKEQRRSLKNTMATSIEDARRKLTYAKSIRLADVKVDAPRTEHATSLSKNLQNRFRENGKIKYDSNNNHGYYNKKGKEKTRRRPYSPSVGDIID